MSFPLIVKVSILVHMLECVGWVYVHHWGGGQGKECRERKGSWGGGEGGKMMGNTFKRN